MRHIIKIILLSLLVGCSGTIGYVPDLQQGNILYPDKVDRIKPGMTIDEVVGIMGSPVLTDTFNDNRVDYVYTFRKHHQKMEIKKVIIHLSYGRVTSITKQM